MRELSEKHSIPGYDHDLTEDEIREFEDKLDDAIVQQSSRIEKIKASFRFQAPARRRGRQRG